MISFSKIILRITVALCILPASLAGCKARGNESPGAASQPPFMSAVASALPRTSDDGGSSTAVMLELARLLCAQRGRYAVWIAFFDGEEAVNLEWQDPDNSYGSRQMAARLATSGDLGKIKAFLLADIVGTKALRIKRDSYSTKALVDLVWATAAKLGYSSTFVEDATEILDDHKSFVKRDVPSVDVIDLEIPYWHM